MAVQFIDVSLEVTWTRLRGLDGLYRFGDCKDVRDHPNWAKVDVIYRWLKASTGEVAVIGETDRQLTARVDNYTSAKPDSSAGDVNKKVFQEHYRLVIDGDGLALELLENVPGFDLTNQRERRFAEKLLIAVTRPYLQ